MCAAELVSLPMRTCACMYVCVFTVAHRLTSRIFFARHQSARAKKVQQIYACVCEQVPLQAFLT